VSDSPLNAALRHFEAAESNLVKAERGLADIEASIPSGIAFGSDPEYGCALRWVPSEKCLTPLADTSRGGAVLYHKTASPEAAAANSPQSLVLFRSRMSRFSST